ncbi:alpha/beta hydrolase family protein [Nonomuraea basaltis]|uniref:alpha/beta hydrolase family protein n=1 Tax=Nonomuraea basaltis TaxID=2495887 RepID=UPI00110C5656|nr:alpha/beta fold hydrolase [Nonomuraea basaltis]TMR94106.1 alpha/beta fold hydrolase [Nonomuraea basaltis]
MADPLITDPIDTTGPRAATVPLTFAGAGAKLLGVLHVPAGPGPHPVVILLHGFPGNERNFDLAHAARRAGYATLVFHYRGSWGMGGSWSWTHVLEDSAAAVAAMRDPGTVAAHRLAPDRLAVIGHSLGGFAALMTAAADPAVVAAGSVAGFDFGAVAALCRADPALGASYVEAWRDELLPLTGTSAEALFAEMEKAGAAWSLAGQAARLAGRPVLLIGTGRDPVTPAPLHHRPLVEAYEAQPGLRLEHHLFDTDHALADHRVALARTVIGFLDRHLHATS